MRKSFNFSWHVASYLSDPTATVQRWSNYFIKSDDLNLVTAEFPITGELLIIMSQELEL